MKSLFVILKRFVGAALNFGFSSQEGVNSSKQDKMAAAVSYIPLVSPAILLLRKNNSNFVVSHSKQALLLSHVTLSALFIAPYLIFFVRGFLILFILVLIFKSFSERKQLIQLLSVILVLAISIPFSDYIVYLTLLLLISYIFISSYIALKGKRIHIPGFTEIANAEQL